MKQSLLKLAQQAATNPTLIAHLVESQAKRENASWAQLAQKLEIEPDQLAKLGLCYQPREQFFSQDIAQIVGYSGINRVVLLHFLDCARQGLPLKKAFTPRKNVGREMKVNRFMLNTRAWATGLAVILFIVLGAFVMAQPNGTNATLVVTAGQGIVNQAGGAVLAGSVETAVSTGGVVAVHQGDTIRLADNAAAQLRLLDGSTIDLSGGTILAVSELVTNDQSYRARFSLLAGKTFNQVVRLLKPGDAFEIKTPSSTASVRGTIFTVEVRSSGEAFFTVDEGVVRVTMGDQAVDVPVGNQVTAVVGQRLEVVPRGTSTSPTDTPETIREPAESPTEEVPLPETEEPADQAEPDGGETEPNEDDSGETNVNKEQVCHIPPGSVGTGITLEVAEEAVQAHLAHGDYLGACRTPVDVPAVAPTNTAVPAAPVAPDTPIPPPPTDTPVPPPPPPPTDTPIPAPTATPDSGGLVTICHIPAGNPENAQTIQVPWEDLADHLDHGDTMGPCN